jgi:hypothetical protein
MKSNDKKELEPLKAMIKSNQINKIKEIIEDWGVVTSSELSLDSSPCLNSIGDDIVQLVEFFNIDDITSVIYVDGQEHSQIDVPYEELPTDVLDEVYEIMKAYETDMIKTYDRTKS